MEEYDFNENFEESETLETKNEEKKSGLKIKIAIGLSFVSGALITLAVCNHKSKKRARKLQIAIGNAKIDYGNARIKKMLAEIMPLVNKRYIIERYDDFRGCTIGTLDDYLDDLANSGAIIKKLNVKEA